jgi:succinate-semialdehyde dehydrogenase / glutarate-semialdehyde dehydrogenase
MGVRRGEAPGSNTWCYRGFMAITSINPSTGKPIRTYDELSPDEAAAIIVKSHEAWQRWRKTSFATRAGLMTKAAAILTRKKDELARLMALEMGKPIAQGAAEIEKCAWACGHFAEHAEKYLAPETVGSDASKSYVAFEPLGTVLAVMPWNFPFWQVVRFAAPSLMAGNAGVLKHASNVPGCALAIEKAFCEAGFPDNVFRTLLVGSGQVKALIEHPLVRAVTLTGSTPAGKSVASQAGAVIKKTVLELGGSDPYIVLEDADLEHAVKTCVNSRLINGGQSCIAAKRFVVVETVREQFTQRFVALMKTRKMGDPLADGIDIGPQARHNLRDDLHKQVRESIERGAVLLLGGEIPPGDGAYYPPTVLTNVRPGMPAYDEELFGPVAAIIAADDEAAAIQAANDTSFGLGAAVFTRDLARGERVARELEAGSTFVNALVASDPRLPFGGIKQSGYGRELSSYGIKEFVNIKTVYIR